jgi:hypothetical protein
MHELTVGFFASQAFSIIIVLVADAQLREDVCPAKSMVVIPGNIFWLTQYAS